MHEESNATNQLRRNHLQSKLQAKKVWMTPLNFAIPTYGEAGYLNQKISLHPNSGISKIMIGMKVETALCAKTLVQT